MALLALHSKPLLADDLDITLDVRDLGSGYAQLLSVAAEPEIAASSLNIESDEDGVDNAELRGTHLPYYREFNVEDSESSWYTQISVSYMKLSEDYVLDLTPDISLTLKPEWEALSGLAEIGFVFPLGYGFSLAPGISAGVSRLENEAELRPGSTVDELPKRLDGELFNWSTNAVLGRAHLGLRYDQKHSNFRVKGVAHLTYTYVDSYSESRDFAGFSDHSGAAILKLDVSRRINSDSAERGMYLIGHLGTTSFIGENRSDLGFDSIHEVGLSLGIDRYAAGLLYLFGEDADGLTVTFNYDF
jgi:hypothetical protein